jgi:hypothetical protein
MMCCERGEWLCVVVRYGYFSVSCLILAQSVHMTARFTVSALGGPAQRNLILPLGGRFQFINIPPFSWREKAGPNLATLKRTSGGSERTQVEKDGCDCRGSWSRPNRRCCETCDEWPASWIEWFIVQLALERIPVCFGNAKL